MYTVVGVQYYKDFDSTKMCINEILEISEQHKNWTEYLAALASLSWCAEYHKRMTDFRSLIVRGNQFMTQYANELKQSDTDFAQRAAMMNATGLYYYSISDYPRAIEEYSRIVSLSTKPVTNDSTLIRSTCNYLAQSYQEIGNFDLSRQYFDLAMQYVNPGNPDYMYRKAMNMMYQGQWSFSLKEYNRAFASYRKAVRMLEELPYRPHIRNALRSAYYVTAGYYSEMEKFDSALVLINKSLEYHVDDDPYYVSTYTRLGSVYQKQEKYPLAIANFEKAFAVADRLYSGGHRDKSMALRGLAEVHSAMGNFSTARSYYRQALAQLTNRTSEGLTRASSSPKESLASLKGLGRLYFDHAKTSGQQILLDSCIQTFIQGASFVDGLRKELVNLETKEFMARESTQLYSIGVEAAFTAYATTGDPKYIENIFFFIEKSKGNILTDKALDRKARNFAGIPEEVLDEERALLGALAVVQKQLLTNNNEALQQQYLLAQRDYLKFVDALEKDYPAYHALKYSPRTTRVQDVRNELAPAEAVINYFSTDSVVYLIAIEDDRTIVDTVRWSTRLTTAINNLLLAISDPGRGEVAYSEDAYLAFIRNSYEIYERILQPVLTKMPGATKLVIIPDGKLCYIPFEALVTKPATGETFDYSGLPYLLRDYNVRYAYSASLESAHTPRDGYRQTYLGFAPSYEEISGPRNSTVNLAPLVNNQLEVQEAADLWGGELFLDSAASERAFKQHALSTNILHLAAHGVIDDLESANTGIVLRSGGTDDGFLFAYELYAISLNAGLAILSGCETGVGKESRGEGMKSLARAFRFAGCNSIVMSLWKVSDKTSRDIMRDFHKNLKSGMEKDEALRMAKLAYLERSPLTTPFYWSAFVLVGDDQPLETTNRTLAISLITACLFASALFIYRRKRRNLFRSHHHQVT